LVFVFQVFIKYGDLKSVTVVRDIVTGFSKHYGFVVFKDAYECERARRKTHKTVLKGKEILVDFEFQQTLSGWVPRRLGTNLATCSTLFSTLL